VQQEQLVRQVRLDRKDQRVLSHLLQQLLQQILPLVKLGLIQILVLFMFITTTIGLKLVPQNLVEQQDRQDQLVQRVRKVSKD
jgi:hypothetical protein